MSRNGFRSDIQGIRAIAVLAVMVFHFNSAWLPGGFVGVDVFMVISGFLITCILLKDKTRSSYTLSATLKAFYISRLVRIAPAYFVMLASVALLSAIFFLPADFEIFEQSLKKAVYFNSNDYFANFGDYFSPSMHEHPLLHTWSLAVEIQFYLIAPFFVLVVPKRILVYVLVGMLFGLTLVAEYHLRVLGEEQATYYSLCARLPAFFAGALAALYLNSGQKPKKLSAVGLLLILLFMAAQPWLGPFPGLAALLPVLGCVFLLISDVGRTNSFLSCRLLMWLGALSYSLYLWHWPVLAYFRYYAGTELLSLTYGVSFVVVTALLSIFSYYFIEKPLRQGKFKLVGFSMVFAVIGVLQYVGNINNDLASAMPVEYTRYADPENICHGKIVNDCLKGDKSSDQEILVLGDSHAAMLNPFFEHLGEELRFKSRIVTASGCVTIDGFDIFSLPNWARAPCALQIEEANRYVSNADVIFIAGKWSQHILNANFNGSLHRFIKTHSSEAKNIYLISQVPQFKGNPLRAERFRKLGIPLELERDPAAVKGNAVIENIAAQYPNVHYLDFTGLDVFSNAPFYDDKLIYRDEHHINEVGSRIYAQAARPVLAGLKFCLALGCGIHSEKASPLMKALR